LESLQGCKDRFRSLGILLESRKLPTWTPAPWHCNCRLLVYVGLIWSVFHVVTHLRTCVVRAVCVLNIFFRRMIVDAGFSSISTSSTCWSSIVALYLSRPTLIARPTMGGCCVCFYKTCAEFLVFQLHVCHIGTSEETMRVGSLEELEHLGSGSANSKKTINSLLDTASACPAPMTSQVQGIKWTMIVVRLPVTHLPLALCVQGVDSDHSDTHRTVHA
jgi:hypothetical protein